MSATAEDDLSRLFTPPRTPTAASPSLSERAQTPNSPVPRQVKSFYVEPPVLASDEKSKYKQVKEQFVASGFEFSASDNGQIIGEYRECTDLYYFVRFQDGIAHKFHEEWLMSQYRDLIKDYERNKQAGLLGPFDPTAHYIHPRSRIRNTMITSSKRAFAKNPALKSVAREGGKKTISVDGDSEPYGSSDSEEEDQEASDGDYGAHPRRSLRAAKKPVKTLPFSPKRKRARKGFVVPDSDVEEDESEIEEFIPPRRSSRPTKNTKAKYAEDEYVDEDESEADDDDDDGERSRKSHKVKVQKTKTKKIIRGKASRPAYGNIRHVADLDYDAFSDEETKPLRAHRDVCEKCHRRPAHVLIAAANRKSKGKGRRKKDEDMDDFEGDEMERLIALGGWVRCLKCPVVAHWGCLARTQRHEILKASQDRAQELVGISEMGMQANAAGQDSDNDSKAPARMEIKNLSGLTTSEITEFICGSCMKGGICMGCMEVALVLDSSIETQKDASSGASANDDSLQLTDGTQGVVTKLVDESIKEQAFPRELLFRCFTCKRLSHYKHLPVPAEYSNDKDSVDPVTLAEYYQSKTEWLCGDCSSYNWELDKVLAWRPYPSTAVEPRPADEPSYYKSPLPREYLVKWLSRSYRRTQWVPHMWLVTTHGAKLKNFLNSGPKVQLLAEALPDEDAMEVDDEADKVAVVDDASIIPFEIASEADQESTKSEPKALEQTLAAVPDAERRIPLAWKTIDRVLDVLLWRSAKRKKSQGGKKGKQRKGKDRSKVSISDDENENDAIKDQIDAELVPAFAEGEQPSEDLMETVAEWEARTGRKISTGQIKDVAWAFIKWDELSFEEATWDSPPLYGKCGYTAFETAFKRFVNSRQVHVMKLTKDELKALENRPRDEYKRKYALNREEGEQPDLGQSKQLSLMPFQIDGVNWLCDNWWRLQHCILADEMGLGKTVQIVTFLGTIIDRWKAFPALVVVPNSTITNWVREFERWAPNLRVVPFYGEMKSREIIKKFELEHETKKFGTTGTKFHVLVTTYESVYNPKDFTPVFKKIPRWEVLIVDEGQRLKSDSSLLFKKLNELHTIHRIIMTGTPLNNNMRELFNLMNFLDPVEWHDLEALEKEHEVLTDDLIKLLHERLRPYFLRRVKSEVLQLPPKNEVIVPVSMAPLQKEVYRSILGKNLSILKSLAQPTNAKINTTTSKLNNILMELRKCLQHPYLINDDIEPRGLSEQETQHKLIDGSAKLRLLKVLLPQLKARGHRVLLFSQFVIALNIVEDFLHGEGFKYLRLDGNTKGAERQRGMDEYNRPDSDVFIYLLTTRAGGVGINLWSADTVIIFDPDFNPHQDLQAIARAHRYGQKKTCLVFKLMVKDSAEERIMQTGKKKLVLDHLIVQKMDDEETAGSDVQSFLTFGAKALFEEGEQGAQDITYTDNDIEKLIEKTEKEGDQEELEKKEGLSFAFAKIWAADKDALEEMADDMNQINDKDDSWAQTLARIAAEREKVQAQEVTGRGVRRRAAAAPQQMIDFDDITPVKGKKKSRKSTSKSMVSEESDAYTGSAFGGSDGEDTDDAIPLTADDLLTMADQSKAMNETPKRMAIKSFVPDNTSPSNSGAQYRDEVPLSPIHNTHHDDHPVCSLCGVRHGDGACYMTESSENLAEYRQMLILHADDEPVEDRQAAIRVIDRTLHKRGKIHLINGQPLHLLDKMSVAQEFPPKMKIKHTYSASTIDKQPSTSTANAVVNTFPMALTSPGPVVSSKRASSPSMTVVPISKKKKAEPVPSSCDVCGQTPFHLVKDCPKVLDGPRSVSKEIKRLGDDPKHASTVNILSKILKKQKRRELAQSSSNALVISD